MPPLFTAAEPVAPAPAPAASAGAVAKPASFRYRDMRLHIPHLVILTTTPLIGAYGLATTAWHPYTLALFLVWYVVTALGITAGYHRLWAHRSYTASLPLRLVLAFAGTGALQGSIRWWSRGHRAHHRYTDTDQDPYSAKRGLFWSHVGWMIFKDPVTSKLRHVDMRDLDADPIVRVQHRYYLFLGPAISLLFPTLVAGLGWGDWRGGYLFAGVLRQVLVHHATFCVNSLAHWLGEAAYDDEHTPRDHLLTALVTMGEGNHSYHHTFPNDYRNAVLWWQWDPTKWAIRACAALGLARGLRRFPDNEVRKARVVMWEKRVREARDELDWGRAAADLPRITMADFHRECRADPARVWTVIGGFVHDVTSFVDDHPGGASLIRSARGRDATADFNGAVHRHRSAARNLLATLRVAVIVDESEGEVATAAAATAADG